MIQNSSIGEYFIGDNWTYEEGVFKLTKWREEYSKKEWENISVKKNIIDYIKILKRSINKM